MNEKGGTAGLGRFFNEKYQKLVRYFQFNYRKAEDIVSDLMADLLVFSRVFSLSSKAIFGPETQRRRERMYFQESWIVIKRPDFALLIRY